MRLLSFFVALGLLFGLGMVSCSRIELQEGHKSDLFDEERTRSVDSEEIYIFPKVEN